MTPHEIRLHFATHALDEPQLREFLDKLTDLEWAGYLRLQPAPGVVTREDYIKFLKDLGLFG